MAYLEAGPAASGPLVRDVLGLARTPRGLADRIARALLAEDPRVTRTGDGRWALAVGGAAPPPALDACRFAVVDVEATGTSPRRGARVIEVAIATIVGGDVHLAYETLVNPGLPIGPFVSRLTGITDAMVRDAPVFDRVADDVLGALAGAVFVAHHARFDWTFVSAELQSARALHLAGPRLCTVRLARRLLPALASRSLDALAHYFGFEVAGRHRAGPDALAAARILGRLLGIARDLGATTLEDLGKVRNADCGMR
ncbi:MAG TPA: exonuclease domain-containing protein, partial [Gemmatimonadales bacterium]|nr:exonuclease domain-containing protein [Gemmatimonadales bacterium]